MDGEVISFDEDAGYGVVRAENGAEHFFHCTAVADGTRAVPVGARVHFVVVAGRRGLWEAADLAPIAGP
jgi:cold shock CspA family protein